MTESSESTLIAGPTPTADLASNLPTTPQVLKVSFSYVVCITLQDGNRLRMQKRGWINMSSYPEPYAEIDMPEYVTMLKELRKENRRVFGHFHQTTPIKKVLDRFHANFKLHPPVAAPPDAVVGEYELIPGWVELPADDE